MAIAVSGAEMLPLMPKKLTRFSPGEVMEMMGAHGLEIPFFIGKMAIEIVDLPINSMVIVHSYVSLPEGVYIYMYIV